MNVEFYCENKVDSCQTSRMRRLSLGTIEKADFSSATALLIACVNLALYVNIFERSKIHTAKITCRQKYLCQFVASFFTTFVKKFVNF